MTGEMVVGDTEYRISLADLSLFHSIGFSLVDAVEQQYHAVALGDTLEPIQDGDPVPNGLYEVVEIEGDDICLSRLHSNEDGKLATTQRLSWIAKSQIESFRRLEVEEKLRP